MSNTIYLYLKTHNKTGLKYLGKTVRDPYQYRGSGLVWNRHLDKHGDDVTTEVLFGTIDVEEFKKAAIEFSEKWNIVESEEFANMTIEQGQGGVTQIGESHHLFGKPWGRGIKGAGAREKNPNFGKRGLDSSFGGKKHTMQTKQAMSEKAKMKYSCPHCEKKMNKGNLSKHLKKCGLYEEL